MSTKAMPPIPPRPMRADKHSQMATENTLGSEMPKIPPRPINRRIERSQSPHRDSYAPSPLNEPCFLPNHGAQPKTQVYSSGSANVSTQDLPRRPPSVTMPSLGQEGNEYAEIFSMPEELAGQAPQTRSVANDLQLHAPKPSLPVSSAKQRVSTVTRTDSNQAAALGIGKANSDDADPHDRSLKEKASFVSQNSNSTERAPSISDSEHGIPEIGQRVPMYPNAGDVQAPSPAPGSGPFAPGIGFHNDGSKPRHHGRKTSARGFEGPPGSYGLHGHGIVPNDRFEKLYYEKHPDLLKKETGHYSGALGDGRGEWALSSEDLNKIVRDTASRGSGLGTSPAFMSTPSEQIGYIASEEYTTRMSTPGGYHNKAHSNNSQTHVDSPLRKGSLPNIASGIVDPESTSIPTLQPDVTLESETDDDDVVHVEAPEYQAKSLYGLSGQMESRESLGQYVGTPHEEDEEHVYSVPILASDEVAKDPFGYELQPAVSPLQERSSSEPHTSNYRSQSASSSRPSSRPVSIHGGIPGMRFQSEMERDSHHTALEDLDEYEPLFPEDEKLSAAKLSGKPLTVADKLKRPDLKNRKFPSQDIWEDAPNSVYYTATVSSPQLPEDKEEHSVMKDLQVREGESPEQAFARRQEELAEKEARDPTSFLSREKKPWAHNADLDTRPNMKQRFPSRDIWESTPDSLQLTTTVNGPQLDEKEIVNLPEERPTTGAVVYHQEKAAAGIPLGEEEGRATTGIAAALKPQVPARPSKQKPTGVTATSATSSPTDKVAPSLPAKPKPQVPARPGKSISKEPDTAPLTKVTSAGSTKSVESDQGSQSVASKPKPPVPSRPVGSKIAALQGGFMADLNKRLQLGPQVPKNEEPVAEQVVEEKDQAPLADARKGRARGPVRRAPAKSPAPVTESVTTTSNTNVLGFSKLATLWHIHPDDGITRVASHNEEPTIHSTSKVEEPLTSALAFNTAGESLHEPAAVGHSTEKLEMPVQASVEDVHAQETEDQRKHMVAVTDDQVIASSKLSDEPPVASATEAGAPAEVIKPTSESIKEPSNENESRAPLTSTMKDTLETIVGGKEALTGGEPGVTEKEQMPGSFEQ